MSRMDRVNAKKERERRMANARPINATPLTYAILRALYNQWGYVSPFTYHTYTR